MRCEQAHSSKLEQADWTDRARPGRTESYCDKRICWGAIRHRDYPDARSWGTCDADESDDHANEQRSIDKMIACAERKTSTRRFGCPVAALKEQWGGGLGRKEMTHAFESFEMHNIY